MSRQEFLRLPARAPDAERKSLLASELGRHCGPEHRHQVKDKSANQSEPDSTAQTDGDSIKLFNKSFAAYCRAKAIPGVVGFSECLTERAEHCAYVVIFPHGSLCQHPAHMDIARNTRQPDEPDA